MASPFKIRKDDEALSPRDIKSRMEQSNYTYKYLQTLGPKLLAKKVKIKEEPVSPKIKPEKQVVKPLFKPFKASKTLSLQPKTSSQEEFLKKVNERLKLLETVIPETPQTESSKHSSKIISILENSKSESSRSDNSENDEINQVATNNWRKPSKLFYQHSTPLDLLLEEKSLGIKSFSANNIYEWNIDGQTEYQIMNTL